jgi:hypothetical protein
VPSTYKVKLRSRKREVSRRKKGNSLYAPTKKKRPDDDFYLFLQKQQPEKTNENTNVWYAPQEEHNDETARKERNTQELNA